MENKTVLITGSTSGIGLGIAKAFAQQGYNLIFNGLEKDGADIAQQVAHTYNIKHLFLGANMLQPQALYNMVQQTLDVFGAVDVLINNAGIQHVAPIEYFPDEKWNEIIGINLTSAFHLIKAVWPSMKVRKCGRIINIASAHGLVASPYKSAYVAAKHGLVGLTKTVALEGAPFGITANAICPGYVKTPLVERQINDLASAHNLSEEQVVKNIILDRQAIKEFIPVETISSMTLYLASEHAATITGAVLSIDGGWTAQ
jgi:3-hydroxybutyrate dehydrogenase